MARALLSIYAAIFLLLFSHPVKAQQLPDSLLTVNEPMMVLPDSISNVVAVDSVITLPIGWPWPAIGGISESVPWPEFYTVTLTLPSAYSVYYVTVDSTPFIPHTDSFLGAKTNTVTARRIPDAAEAAGFAESLHRFTVKKEEQ